MLSVAVVSERRDLGSRLSRCLLVHENVSRVNINSTRYHPLEEHPALMSS